ncbi:unnamed protein product [Brassica rapa]|uniref:Replication factor A C-terminal domain-containing protein n=2 Tax=Brassica TaxID=3705 RepID=A0A8D9LVY0_BRACM|nr:unnamed protein product [Brassica napus]CAG7888907.1 unnamed protein product [Brassica rapa]
MAMKRNGKSPASSDSDEEVMFFKDVSLGPHETQLRFRLIHFWEAPNPVKKTLIGLEMLLIDEQGTVIQGFIPPRRIKKYLHDMKRGSVYKLINFYGLKNKPFQVLHEVFSWTMMSSLRSIFMDYDVQPTRDYFSWLSSNPEIANQVRADVITKRETLTIADIFSYMTQESAKCTATIDDVVHGSSWYYIACSECHSKATKGPSSLICTNKRCGKSEQAFFVLLGDAGHELTGRHASELVNSYFEANKSEESDHVVPVLEALISTIGQTHKFCVKVTYHNFSGNTQAITVTKILPLDTPPPTEASVGNAIAATSEEAMQSGNEESKRTCTRADPETAKRPRCENWSLGSLVFECLLSSSRIGFFL